MNVKHLSLLKETDFIFIYYLLSEMTTVLVTGSMKNNKQMEIIDESKNITKTCKQSLDFPYKVNHAIGCKLDDGSVKICGGAISGKKRLLLLG